MTHGVEEWTGTSLWQRLKVAFAYPVHFTRGVFSPANDLLEKTVRQPGTNRPVRCFVMLDGGLAAARPGLAGEVEAWFAARRERLELAAEPLVLPGGEAAKNDPDLPGELIGRLLEARLCRHSYLIAAGGGAVLDAAGFAGALFHRGLRLVRLPSTVLAQNDAGVGVKNGVNRHGIKNALGTFAPPFAVINDLEFLRTLADRDWIGGVAEAFKVALIRDAEFLEWLTGAAPALAARGESAMEEAVRRCADLHLRHIREGGDPFESGEARPLDFGHWSAHKLESLSHNRIGHGEAVAFGLALDCAYAVSRGWLGGNEFERVAGALRTCGFPLWYPECDDKDEAGRLRLLEGLEEFREHLGGELTLTFPDGPGRSRDAREVDIPLMLGAHGLLREKFGGGGAS